MEVSLVDEDFSIENIGNHKALKYRVKYNGKVINNVPVFKHWLYLMKTEKQYDGIICYCINCFLFFYFRDKREKNEFRHNDYCTHFDYAEFCEYCGELFADSSICCYKKGIQSFKKELYDNIWFDCLDYILYVPFLSLVFYFTRFFCILTSLRLKGQDINYKYESYYILENKFILTLFVFLSFCYSLIFSILYTGIYIWHVIFFNKIWKLKIEDKNNHFIRY